jgi:RNA polymerase sigma-70 factor (ECF subfamily)
MVTKDDHSLSDKLMGNTVVELVSRAKAGDQAAFEMLVRATHADTYALAYRLTGNEEDASDVLQDTYLRAYRALRRFRGDAAFTTWLYRITANCATTHLARRGRARHEELSDDIPLADHRPAVDPEAMADAAAERDQVTAALSALPDRLRVVVVLRDIYDLPHEAIAAELGISETAAKVRLHRARKKLRERLYPTREERHQLEEADAV